MSALPVPGTSRPSPRPSAPRRHLRAVVDRTASVSRLPFLLILAGTLAVGLLGLVLLNTALQDQAFEMRQLHREQARLANLEAHLEARVEQVSSPASLAGKASALGMRANTHSVFLVVPDGRIIGEPTPVEGNELESSVVKAPAQAGEQKQATQQQGTETASRNKAAADKAAAEKAAADKAAQDEAAAEKAAQDKAAQDKAAAEKQAADEAARKKAEQSRPKTAEEQAAEQQARNQAEAERAKKAATGGAG